MKFFIYGLGSIGLRHAKNLLALGHEVCGYDMFPEKFIQASEELGIPIDVPGHDDMDAYVICTPPSEHYDNMVEAVSAGKHIFVEKPLSDVRQLVQGGLPELLEEAKRKNLVVMVGNMLRFHPEVRRVKPLVRQPWQAIFQVLQKNKRYTEPVLLNWGAHEIDLALYLFGPAAVSEATGWKDIAVVTLEHASGVRSVIRMDYLTDPEVRKFEIDETNGATLDVDLRLPARLGWRNWNDVYMDEMLEFIGRIKSTQNPLMDIPDWVGATGDDGLATLKIIAEAMRMANAS